MSLEEFGKVRLVDRWHMEFIGVEKEDGNIERFLPSELGKTYKEMTNCDYDFVEVVKVNPGWLVKAYKYI